MKTRKNDAAVGCDMYNFSITGDVAVTINATSCDSPSHSGPSVLILNDMGGEVMNTSDDVTSTLRAQDHGHPPVVCFEPGIMSRDCSAGNRAYIDICSTLRAQMGDNQPAVCYSFAHRQISMMVGENQTASLVSTDYKDPQLVCYEVNDGQHEVPESVGSAEQETVHD